MIQIDSLFTSNLKRCRIIWCTVSLDIHSSYIYSNHIRVSKAMQVRNLRDDFANKNIEIIKHDKAVLVDEGFWDLIVDPSESELPIEVIEISKTIVSEKYKSTTCLIFDDLVGDEFESGGILFEISRLDIINNEVRAGHEELITRKL